jgi:hypothetical protein
MQPPDVLVPFNTGVMPPASMNLDSIYDALEDISAVDSVPHWTYDLGTTTSLAKLTHLTLSPSNLNHSNLALTGYPVLTTARLGISPTQPSQLIHHHSQSCFRIFGVTC